MYLEIKHLICSNYGYIYIPFVKLATKGVMNLDKKLRDAIHVKTPSDLNIWSQMRENYEAIILEDCDFSQAKVARMANNLHDYKGRPLLTVMKGRRLVAKAYHEGVACKEKRCHGF